MISIEVLVSRMKYKMSTPEKKDEPELQVMVWYNENDWQTLQSLFDDAHLLPKNNQAWLQRADKKIRDVEASGELVFKVTIDPVLFPQWCKETGRKMDAESRTTFAIEAIQKQQFLGTI